MPNEPTINPYNFVPIPQTGPNRAASPGWLHVALQSYSGNLRCELEALSPLFSADHQKAPPPGQRRWFPFLRNSQKEPILQGTTVKGMVRAVHEALSLSCLPLTATSGSSKKAGADVEYFMTPLSAYAHSGCDSRDTLCPACRLFGVIQGDEVHVRGRVIFTDAVLCQGELTQKQIRLQELSSPKPHHYQMYSKTRKKGGSIAGRKFFYHHDPDASLGVEVVQWSPRANGVTEVAPVGTRFAFDVRFDGLTAEELANLIRALVLEDGLGHKVGMGKPIGFGSCRIHIKPSASIVHQGASRYQAWNASPIALDIAAFKPLAHPFSPELQEVLRRDKYKDGDIGYLSFQAYKDDTGIDSQGKYRTGKKTGSVSGATIVEKGFKKGDKIRVEVVASEGNRYTLRVQETPQQEIFLEAIHLPWKVGDRRQVTIESVGPDGRIKKVRP